MYASFTSFLQSALGLDRDNRKDQVRTNLHRVLSIRATMKLMMEALDHDENSPKRVLGRLDAVRDDMCQLVKKIFATQLERCM